MPATETHTDLIDALEESVTRLAHLLLRESAPGLSRTSAAVLARLRDAGPQRVTDLAAFEAVAQPTMTSIVGRLCEQGLCARGADPSDGRAVLVSVTPAGIDELAARRAARAGVLARRVDHLDADERRTVERAVPVLRRLAAVTA